jgi:hypothetical protein
MNQGHSMAFYIYIQHTRIISHEYFFASHRRPPSVTALLLLRMVLHILQGWRTNYIHLPIAKQFFLSYAPLYLATTHCQRSYAPPYRATPHHIELRRNFYVYTQLSSKLSHVQYIYDALST